MKARLRMRTTSAERSTSRSSRSSPDSTPARIASTSCARNCSSERRTAALLRMSSSTSGSFWKSARTRGLSRAYWSVARCISASPCSTLFPSGQLAVRVASSQSSSVRSKTASRICSLPRKWW